MGNLVKRQSNAIQRRDTTIVRKPQQYVLTQHQETTKPSRTGLACVVGAVLGIAGLAYTSGFDRTELNVVEEATRLTVPAQYEPHAQVITSASGQHHVIPPRWHVRFEDGSTKHFFEGASGTLYTTKQMRERMREDMDASYFYPRW